MRVSIGYPPLESERGRATLGQNRQFEWFSHPTYIYPMVPALAATLLAEAGHEVVWNDAIAEGWSYARFLEAFTADPPDLIVLESKTPVIGQHWRIIGDLKRISPGTRVALWGDHVTALPEESLARSAVDFVLTGGELASMLTGLCDHLERGAALPAGVWLRSAGSCVRARAMPQRRRSLDELPFIDRELTRWELYGEHLFHKPCTYTMVGQDCWRPRCTFCSWTTLWPRFQTRSAESLLAEIEAILDRLPVREIFDDTGTFPAGGFLQRFCRGMIERGIAGRVHFSCNMRINALGREDYDRMAAAGFRVVKFGIESANQATLDRLDKGTTVEDLVRGCQDAKAAGLAPHLTTMVGYPWETRDDARRTLDLARELFQRGFADTLQATVVMPYPGTPLFEEAERSGWLRFGREWEHYDMTKPVMRTEMDDAEIMEMVKGLYGSCLSVPFVVRKLASIRSLDDVRYLARAARAVTGHIADFARARRRLGRPSDEAAVV